MFYAVVIACNMALGCIAMSSDFNPFPTEEKCQLETIRIEKVGVMTLMRKGFLAQRTARQCLDEKGWEDYKRKMKELKENRPPFGNDDESVSNPQFKDPKGI